jgi:hypothetical protein
MAIRLDDKEAIQSRRSPRLKSDIEKARNYESVLRIFTEPMFRDEIALESAWCELKTSMKSCLSGQQMYMRALNFMYFPLPVVNIAQKNLSDIYKVFDSRNSYFHYQINNRGAQDELSPMLEKMSPVRWIEEQGRKVLSNQPCSVVVIDKDEMGQPYLILVDIDRVIDAEFTNECELEYIMFKHSKKGDVQYVALYDADSYRVYREDEDDKGDPTLILESDTPHSLGKCPARMFISNPLNSRVGFSRWSPLAATISKMHEWTAFDAYKRYADHYAAFPMIQIPEEICEIEGCKDGLIPEERHYVEDGQKHTRTEYTECPACAKRETVGPGVVIEMSVKQTKDDPDIPDTKFVDTPVKSLEYLDKKLDRIERNISLNSVGVDKLMELEAVNEQQVNGAFETRKNVLLNIKRHFDDLYSWILVCTVKLVRPDVRINVHGDFGTDFYLESENEIQILFERAKKSGLPASEVEMLYKQLIETKYRNDPGKQTRTELLYLIDPMPFDNEETAIRKVQMGTVTEEDMILHDNLVAWVNRFETEQGPINQFGIMLPLSARLNSIRTILKSYRNEGKSLRFSGQAVGEEGVGAPSV